MSGRYLTWVCWLGQHGEPLWSVTARGHGWRCPTCQRWRASAVLQGLAGEGR